MLSDMKYDWRPAVRASLLVFAVLGTVALIVAVIAVVVLMLWGSGALTQ